MIPQWRGILRRRRKIHEYNTRYFKIHEISTNHRLSKRKIISGDIPMPVSTGFNAYWHWVISTSIFRKSWKSVFFFEIRKIEPFPGSPFSDHFWRFFSEKFCIALFLGKILVANYRIVCEVNFAPKAQNFSTDIRKSAVLDAVLEDKPAQPLPCGSYLVRNSGRTLAPHIRQA